jgi:hypothetical protein
MITDFISDNPRFHLTQSKTQWNGKKKKKKKEKVPSKFKKDKENKKENSKNVLQAMGSNVTDPSVNRKTNNNNDTDTMKNLLNYQVNTGSNEQPQAFFDIINRKLKMEPRQIKNLEDLNVETLYYIESTFDKLVLANYYVHKCDYGTKCIE